jgi:hypothetical protein
MVDNQNVFACETHWIWPQLERKHVGEYVFTDNTVQIQGDQKVSVQLMITIQKVTGNVQNVPRQSPDIY